MPGTGYRGRGWWLAGHHERPRVGIGVMLGAGGILLAVPAVAAASGTLTALPSVSLLIAHPSSSAAAHAVRWGCLLGMGVDLAILLGAVAVRAHIGSLFIGTDHRISTSKTVAAAWTLLVAAILFGLAYANLLNHPQALNATSNSGVAGQYAVLFGGPLGSAILAKQIVNGQESTKTIGTPQARDLIANDAGDTDLGDLQYVLFNGVAMFYVIGTLLHAPLSGLPHIPDTLLALTSVSAVGYVGKKALRPGTGPTATIDPGTRSGPANTPVRIVMSGLAPDTQTVRAWVSFGSTDSPGQVVHPPATAAQGNATLQVRASAITIAPHTPVDVSVVTDDGAVLSAGQFTYS